MLLREYTQAQKEIYMEQNITSDFASSIPEEPGITNE